MNPEALTVLPPTEAWSAGADLWVFSRQPSKLLSRLDWLLNFQISNSKAHKPQALHKQTQDILQWAGLQSVDFAESAPDRLLISSLQFLPTQWVLLLGNAKPINAKPIEEWTSEIHKNWLSLGRPSLRVFIPDFVDLGQFKKVWKKLQPTDSMISVVASMIASTDNRPPSFNSENH